LAPRPAMVDPLPLTAAVKIVTGFMCSPPATARPRQSGNQTEPDASKKRLHDEIHGRHISTRTSCQQRITASGKKTKITTSATIYLPQPLTSMAPSRKTTNPPTR
jgi:hypothetical protein